MRCSGRNHLSATQITWRLFYGRLGGSEFFEAPDSPFTWMEWYRVTPDSKKGRIPGLHWGMIPAGYRIMSVCVFIAFSDINFCRCRQRLNPVLLQNWNYRTTYIHTYISIANVMSARPLYWKAVKFCSRLGSFGLEITIAYRLLIRNGRKMFALWAYHLHAFGPCEHAVCAQFFFAGFVCICFGLWRIALQMCSFVFSDPTTTTDK